MKGKVLEIQKELTNLDFQKYTGKLTRQHNASEVSQAYQQWRRSAQKLVEDASDMFPNANFKAKFRTLTQELDDPNSNRINELDFKDKKTKIIELLNDIGKEVDKIDTPSPHQKNTEKVSKSADRERITLRIFISHLKEDNIYEKINAILDQLNEIQEQIHFAVVQKAQSGDLTDLMERIRLVESCQASIICLPSKEHDLSPSVYVDLATSINCLPTEALLVIYDGHRLPRGLDSIDSINKFQIVNYDLGLMKGFELAKVIRKLAAN